MSNLLKNQGIQSSHSITRVIDSNELLQEKIHLFELKLQQSQREENPEGDMEGFMEGIAGESQEAPEEAVDYKAEAQAQAEQILQDARSEAEQLLDHARADAVHIKNQAKDDGQAEGYQQGMSQAMEEKNLQLAQLQQKREELEREYRGKQESMEKELVEVISHVFEQVFQIQFEDKQELIIHLVENAIWNIESSREFQIKINEDNYEALQNSKEMIQEKVGSDVKLDIIPDPLLDKNQCVIETDGGVFDCSLGVELENLLRDIRTLSL